MHTNTHFNTHGLCVVVLHREIKLDTSVTDYFHADGYLAETKFRTHVGRLLGQYERLDASSEPRPKALTPGKQD